MNSTPNEPTADASLSGSANMPFSKWLFARRSLAGLGVFRIVLCLIGLQRFGLRWPYVDELYAQGALMNPWGVADQLNFPVFEYQFAMGLYSVMIIAMIFTVIGFHTQKSAGLTALLLIYFVSINEVFQCHVDNMLIISLGFLAFSPAGKALSVDRWLERNSDEVKNRSGWYQLNATGCIWGQRMIAISFASLYLFAPFLKLLLDGTNYFSGEPLGFAIQRWQFATPASEFLASHQWITMIMAFTGVAGEVFMSFGLFIKKLRPFAIMIGCGMHLTILFTILIPPGLSLIMIASYITFMEPETWALGNAGKLKTEDGKSEVGGKSEIGDPTSEVENQQLEVEDGKSEVGDGKTKIGIKVRVRES